MNFKNVMQIRWYLIVGAILWFSVLQSGVHATLAGVVLGFAIPLGGKKQNAHQPNAQQHSDEDHSHSPLKHLEHLIHPYAAFLILPIFAFANAGVSLEGLSIQSLTNNLSLGVIFGLIIGKPLGIFVFSWVSVKLGVARLPDNVCFVQIFAVSVLCGIGFTMSIFISSLAFVGLEQSFITFSRLGILIGSTIAAVTGYCLLRSTLPQLAQEPNEDKLDY